MVDQVTRNILDAHIQNAKKLVSEYGFTVTGVISTPPFSYTSGFTEEDCSEFIMAGMEHEIAHAIFTSLYRLVSDGVEINSGDELDGLLGDGYKLSVIDIDPRNSGMSVTRALYPEFKSAAVFFPDVNHLFPWDDGVEPIIKEIQTMTLLKAGFTGASH